MKYLYTLLGLTLTLSSLNAEDIQTETASKEVEEIFLDDEFEAELISLKESAQEPVVTEVTLIEAPVENPIASLLTEEEAVSVDLTSIGMEPSLNEEEPAASLIVVQEPAIVSQPSNAVTIDFKQAFSGAPIIYSVLIGMSVFSVCLWLYSLASMRLSTRLSSSLIRDVQNHLNSNHFSEALDLCTKHNNLLSKMLTTGIQTRQYGLPMVVESMKAEAKRSTVSFWQKLGLLNDIAIIAPMLGLLGTVLGMFYAFYDVNRSIESISSLFDGLGISVGTTVAGLLVAILALILHSTAKYRLVRELSKVESQAQSMATLLDDKTHIHHKG
jgi:biopolymer transport protein ExbB